MKKHGFEEMHLKAVLFDMDGVLFDSMPNHALAWSEGMKNYEDSFYGGGSDRGEDDYSAKYIRQYKNECLQYIYKMI